MVCLSEKTVLVVDDEPDLRDMIAFEFELVGSRVLAAGNGLSALGVLESERVDAVVTDIRMAGCDGLELLRNVRDRSPVAPVVILITAYDSDLSPSEAYRMGAEGIFPKPFCLRELVTNVERALTPFEKRWSVQPDLSKPGWTVHCRWRDCDGAREEGSVVLGRGGMALLVESSRVKGFPAGGSVVSAGDPVSFNVGFDAGLLQAIEGSGIVRWVRHGADATYWGIEFEYLADVCRAAVIEKLASGLAKPFIP